MNIAFQLNGRAVDLGNRARARPCWRCCADIGQFSVKRGCETGDCGSCTVLLDGQPVNSCVVAAARVHGHQVTTMEGLLGDDLMIRLQTELVERGAVQCGYCIAGYADQPVRPDETGADRSTNTPSATALTGNLCRCTGYVKPVEAAQAVAAVLEEVAHEASSATTSPRSMPSSWPAASPSSPTISPARACSTPRCCARPTPMRAS